jgi:hypothetical protein
MADEGRLPAAASPSGLSSLDPLSGGRPAAPGEPHARHRLVAEQRIVEDAGESPGRICLARSGGLFGSTEPRLLGLAFLLAEIPLIQQWILLVGQPADASAAVVSVLLVFSSLGSLSARAAWLPQRIAFPALIALAVATPSSRPGCPATAWVGRCCRASAWLPSAWRRWLS